MDYKDHIITKTGTTTTAYMPMPGGRVGTYEKIVCLYDIQGKYGKPYSHRPFITSVAGAKEFINKEIKQPSIHKLNRTLERLGLEEK